MHRPRVNKTGGFKWQDEQNNNYDDDFKATTVALTEIPGIKAADVAEALAIHEVMLYRWCVKEMNDNAFIESFFHQFKTERLKENTVHSEEELRSMCVNICDIITMSVHIHRLAISLPMNLSVEY